MSDLLLKRKTVIVVTDGDKRAFETIKEAARYIKAKIISGSAGNPTTGDPKTIVAEVEKVESSTVIVFADNAGREETGQGNKVIRELKKSGHLHAALAVASDTDKNSGVKVNESVTKRGIIIKEAVDKHGKPTRKRKIKGDTVGELNHMDIPIVGIGDIGKAPHGSRRVQVATLALQEAKELADQNKG